MIMIIDNFFKPWRKLDGEEISEQQKYDYTFSLLEKVCNTYKIECDEIETSSFFIMKYAYLNGHCGLAKFDDGKYYVGRGSFAGEVDADGYGKEYIITLQDGRTKRGKIGEEIVVLKHTCLALPQFHKIDYLADMLAKIDVSLNYNIIYTRNVPIPIVYDDLEEKSMKNALESIVKGTTAIFKRATKRDFYREQTDVRRDTLDITTPQASEYLQHLSRLHDEFILRFALEEGILISSRDKGAQLNNKELDAFADYCAITSDDVFEQLKKFSRDCEKVFGLNVKVTPKAFIYTEKDVINAENDNSFNEVATSQENEESEENNDNES